MVIVPLLDQKTYWVIACHKNFCQAGMIAVLSISHQVPRIAALVHGVEHRSNRCSTCSINSSYSYYSSMLLSGDHVGKTSEGKPAWAAGRIFPWKCCLLLWASRAQAQHKLFASDDKSIKLLMFMCYLICNLSGWWLHHGVLLIWCKIWRFCFRLTKLQLVRLGVAFCFCLSLKRIMKDDEGWFVLLVSTQLNTRSMTLTNKTDFGKLEQLLEAREGRIEKRVT